MQPSLLRAPTKYMTEAVTRAAPHIRTMMEVAAAHGLVTPDLCMQVDVHPPMGTTSNDSRIVADGVMVAPCSFTYFRDMPKWKLQSPIMQNLLKMEGKVEGDMVLMVTDRNAAFNGWAKNAFGLDLQFEAPATLPNHIAEARAMAARTMAGNDPRCALAILHEAKVPDMARAKEIAGDDWPMVEDEVSIILGLYATPPEWGDLIPRLMQEGTRNAVWFLDGTLAWPAGQAYVVQDPSPELARRCVAAGLVKVDWTPETAPNTELAKRIKPGTDTYVWYPPAELRGGKVRTVGGVTELSPYDDKEN